MTEKTNGHLNFDTLPNYPFGQVHQSAENRNYKHAIKDNSNHIYHNRNLIHGLYERMLNGEEGNKKALSEIHKDLKEMIIKKATKEARDILIKDPEFRRFVIESLKQELKTLSKL